MKNRLGVAIRLLNPKKWGSWVILEDPNWGWG